MKEDIYNELTYGGLINRIRDRVALSVHQENLMAECGLTIEDFMNQKSTEEKISIINTERMKEGVSEGFA